MKQMALVFFIALLMSGCGSLRTTEADRSSGEDIEVVEAGGSDQESTRSHGASDRDELYGESLTLQGDELYGADGEPTRRIFYFDFDSATISSGDLEAIRDHAGWLATHSETAVRLEGHADERGSREYNLALGERRGRTVMMLMEAEGVSGTQLDPVSYGEEKPVAMGHNEIDWSQNRRVELIYIH